MCWNEFDRIPVANIATKDIEVFKVLHEDLRCYYNVFQYEYDKEYTTSIGPIKHLNPRVYSIEEGFHSYSLQDVIVGKRKQIINNKNYSLLDYFTGYEGRLIKVRCIIPKGSAYYKNINGEIVSNKIIIKNKISYL